MSRRITLALVALAVLAALAEPSVAAPGGVRYSQYQGSTSDGGSIFLSTSVEDGVVRFQSLGLSVDATCEDGTTLHLDRGIDLSPTGVPIDPAAIEVSEVTFADAFSLTGRLGSKAGGGTVSLITASLDADEEPQVCSTDDLAWHADRISVVGVPFASPAVRFVDRSTGVTTSVGRPVASSDRPAERLRNYAGRTSAGYRMFVVTQKRPDGLVMHELGIAWHLPCDDGTTVLDLGFFIFFAGEPLEPGRLDHDVSAPELAFHVNGRLGSHTGDGTTTSIVPALTEDLQAQGCRSGDVTWRAWRTDAGY